MRVAIAGGHGQIALRLAKVLAQRGDDIIALTRNPNHSDDVRQAGAEPVVVDLERASEDDVARAIAGSDAVVFAAGAGPGSGPERKETMDYGGAVKLIAAAKQAAVGRYVIVSSMGRTPMRAATTRSACTCVPRAVRTTRCTRAGWTRPSCGPAGSLTTPARAASDSARASHAGESPATTSQRSSSLCWTRRRRSAGLWN